MFLYRLVTSSWIWLFDLTGSYETKLLILWGSGPTRNGPVISIQKMDPVSGEVNDLLVLNVGNEGVIHNNYQ